MLIGIWKQSDRFQVAFPYSAPRVASFKGLPLRKRWYDQTTQTWFVADAPSVEGILTAWRDREEAAMWARRPTAA